MFEFAQTNLQLLEQSRRCGLSEQEIERIAQGYWGAIPLFSAMYRGSGKPLLSHLVGTASVLLAIDASVDVVMAGLLHAAYELGDFGTRERGPTPENRAVLREMIGDPAEQIVQSYALRPWDLDHIRVLVGEVDDLSPLDAEVVIVRLANEVDDHLDLGVLYCSNAAERREFIAVASDELICLAEKLGQTKLREHLWRVVSSCLTTESSPATRGARSRTFTQMPLSLKSDGI